MHEERDIISLCLWCTCMTKDILVNDHDVICGKCRAYKRQRV